MKNLIIITASLALSTVGLQGASLIAGWDMSNLTSPVGGSVAANWSDITNDTTSNGTIYWNGTDGSTNIPNGIAGGSLRSSLNLSINRSISTRAVNNQMSISPARSLGFAGVGFAGQPDASNSSFVISAGLDDGFGYNTLILSFAAALANPGSAIDIVWEYNNGSGFVPLGITTSTGTSQSNGGELELVTLDAGITFSNEVLLRGTIGSINGGSQLIIDNVQVTGTAVPEPSTYAIMAGFAVLGLAIIRRRKA